MNLDQLITALEAVKAKHGGKARVVLEANGEEADASRVSVFPLLGDWKQPVVAISDLPKEAR